MGNEMWELTTKGKKIARRVVGQRIPIVDYMYKNKQSSTDEVAAGLSIDKYIAISKIRELKRNGIIQEY